MIITHGWPGSVIEMLKVDRPADRPDGARRQADDAFHVVIPSIPGYGFSGKPDETGWDPDHVARAWVELMSRLGYEHYVAQGGDWGAIITDLMGAQAPAGLLGIHSNMPGTVQPESRSLLGSVRADPPPAGLSARGAGGLRPAALPLHQGHRLRDRDGAAPADALRPRRLARRAGRLDARPRRRRATRTSRRPSSATPVGNLTRDEVLDNITLTWLTNTGVSSARLYWENKLGFFDVKGVKVPAAVSVFPHELYQAPRSWAEAAYPNLIYFNEVDAGNHFAAWQEPELFTSESSAPRFRSLR